MILSWLRGMVLVANPKNGTAKGANRKRIPRKLRYAAMIEQLEDRVVPAATNLFLNFAATGVAVNTVPVARSAAIPVFVDVGTLDSGNVGGSGGIQSADVYIKYDSAVLSINQTSDIKLGSLLTSVANAYSITPITNVPSNVIAFTIAPNNANLYTGTTGGHLAELDFHVLPTIAVGNTTLLDLSASVSSPTRSTDVSDQNGAAYTLTPPLTNYTGTLTQAGALTSADFIPADDDPGDGVIQVVATPTTTTVSTSNATPIYGTAVTLTATVAPASGTTVPTQGSVAFFINGTTPLGTGTFAGSDAGNDALFTYVTPATQLQVAGGDAQPVTATYAAGDGFNSSSSTNTATETVTPAPLTVTSISANNKVYDSTTTATLNTGSAALAGLFSGDVVTLNTSGVTATFASKDVANGISVTASGLTLGGAQAGDYTLTQPTTTANITPAPLTVIGVTADDKVYDSTTATTLNTGSAALAGTVFSGDVVTLVTSGATGAFASKDVANNITVAVAGLTLGGAQAGDYTLTQPTTTANITPAPLTVTGITANNKVYDSTTTATLNTGSASFVGLFSG
ncbi:MAG TPA: YDG domain-containing protein, partial [Gemmataceae bacterium]|nr:YDG domain-containing protein [Gemmataceae bacterium]